MHLAWAVTCMRRIPRRRRGRACGFNPPAFMRRHMAAGDFMGSDAFYNERRFLWEAVRFVWAVSHIWTAPPGGLNPRLCALAASAACGDSMGSDTFYNERRFLWEVIRFVWAVTGIRTAPPVRAEVYAGSTRPRLCAAIWRRSFLWGVVHSIGRRLPWGVVHFV